MSKKLTLESFQPLLNSKFTIKFDSENEYDAELIQINVRDVIESLSIQPFSLLFRADPKEAVFAQRLYTVNHESIGEFSLFLIPRIPDKEGIYYEVIFS